MSKTAKPRPVQPCADCALRRTPLLAHVSDEQWRLFLASRTRHAYRRDNILFYDQNRPLGVFFLCSGRVKILRSDCGRRQQIVRMIEGPGFVGLRGLAANDVYKGTAMVMEPSVLCMAGAEHFWRLVRDSPKALLALARRLANELGEAEDLAEDLALRSIRERLAGYLLRRWARRPAKPAPRLVLLPESRVEIAERLGTTPEAVCRGLAEFRKRRWIELADKRLTVLDEARLAAVSRFSRRTEGSAELIRCPEALEPRRTSAPSRGTGPTARSTPTSPASSRPCTRRASPSAPPASPP